VRGPQINIAGSSNTSGFTLVKGPKQLEDEAEEVKISQEDFRIARPAYELSKWDSTKPKPDSVRSQFFMANEIKYTPIQES
jgi:hypothetical protein